MPSPSRARVVAVGTSLPERVLGNVELERLVETSDEWIVSRTGIRERRIAAPGIGLTDLALAACRQCLAKAGAEPEEIDGIIVATITPDQVMPTTANLLQHRLGATRAFAWDLSNACNGFVAALASAAAFIESGRCRVMLVVGADLMSRVVDYEDRNTCILFGDGAGAVLLRSGPADGPGITGWVLHSDGQHGDLLALPGSGTSAPRSMEELASRRHFVQQDGRGVFQHAVRRMAEVAMECLQAYDLSLDQVDLLVPHQANLRIIEPVARRLELPMEKVVVNLDRLGNTTAATIPLALADAVGDGRLTVGTRVLLVAFGGGFSWGACHLTWG